MQILVIDDDAIIIKSCVRILESEGFEVLASRSAEEAPEIIKKGNFDLLLIDVKMPKRDGLSLVKEIRQDFPKLPIIAMSGYSTTETVADVVRSGATQFIGKPFRPDELLKLIRQVLPA